MTAYQAFIQDVLNDVLHEEVIRNTMKATAPEGCSMNGVMIV